MLEQQARESLKHEETMTQMRELNANHSQRLAGMARMLVNHDEDRPTILRRLMTIENKVDRILEQNKD